MIHTTQIEASNNLPLKNFKHEMVNLEMRLQNILFSLSD
jgi:hypothetical protein